MALWQFALDPTPAEKTGQVSGELNLSPRDRSALFFRLSAILPPGHPWAENMRHWGDEQGDDISFFMSAAGIEGMQIRIDVLNLSATFIEAICTLAQDFGWMFVVETGEIVLPCRDAVLDAIKKSPAVKFVRDPSGFLARARKNASRQQSRRP